MSQQTLTREYHGHTIVSVQCDLPPGNDDLPPEERCDGWEHSVLGEVFQNLGVAIQHAKRYGTDDPVPSNQGEE